MKAIQYTRIGAEPELVDIPTPEPKAGEVLLEITAAGVCHSDEFIMSLPAEQFGYELPMTLGHEGAGRVAAVGAGVTDLDIGTNVVVYGPWGCGRCWHCAQGLENYCSRARELGIAPPGLGAPGAIAEYMIVDSPRHLVPIGDLDPVTTVPLTDAGLTPYHAIKRSLGKLRAGSYAVVIGTGGLGHVGIQLLRHLSPARIIALDVNDEKLAFAREVGAHESVLSNADAAANVRKITGSAGAALASISWVCSRRSTSRPQWPASGPTSRSSGSATGSPRPGSASSRVRTRRMSRLRTGVHAASSSS